MADEDDVTANFTAIFETFALDETAMHARAGKTLAPDRHAASRSMLSLPLVRTDAASGAAAVELILGSTLGQGGMGWVRSAHQLPIGREVAVKTVREDRRTETATAVILLQEAIMTGRLEHPNIVPIYGVGQSEDGAPIVVMKRIQGSEWTQHIADPSNAPGYEGEDPIVWNVQVLLDICLALRHAHGRGILHRDIKPDNVMIGESGEVYLVDWGISVTTREDDDSAMPRAMDVESAAGTPAFMAPEMAAGDGERLSERTDVFLVGASLHLALTGKAPYAGDTLFEVMLEAYKCEPQEYAASLPPELVEICRRAMAADPAERYADVNQLRDALRAYLDHRISVELEARSRERLRQLEAAVGKVADNDEGAGLAIHRSFGECRFGFQQALDVWPDNEAAAEGIQRAIAVMFRFEIQQRSAKGAEMVLSELESVPEGLQRELDALKAEFAEDERRAAELAALEHDLDLAVGSRVRAGSIVVLVVALLIVPSIFLETNLIELTRERHLLFARLALVMVLVGSVVVHAFVLAERANRTNRLLNLTLVASTLMMVVFREVGALLGTPVRDLMVLELASFFLVWSLVALGFDRRLWVVAPLYLVVPPAIVLFDLPYLGPYLFTHGAGLIIAAAIWAKPVGKDASDPPNWAG